MVNGCASTALRQVAGLFQAGTLTGLSDRQMLERFVEDRDEAAFEVLVARHGPMAFSVCKQLLRDPHDAEDAFQAVFLVLVRKAGTIRIEGSLGPWLYTVAHRIAARARANRRRMSMPRIGSDSAPIGSPADDRLDRFESAVVIQEELGRLPERLRTPLVLCYLQGMTHELAASQLGCPVGTVRSRLSRGRAQLLKRITRRGLTLSATVFISALESTGRAAAIPPSIRLTLIKLATGRGAGTAATVGGLRISASVATLLKGVLSVMNIKKLALTAAGLTALGAMGLAIVDRVAAVGGSPIQESAPPGSDPDWRQVGPDGGPIGPKFTPPAIQTITKTYYVGDILEVARRPRAGSTAPENQPQPGPGVGPLIDMRPLINLISSTVAPGTWEIRDQPVTNVEEAATGIRTTDRQGKTGGVKPTGAIVPFFLSISLIIKCTPEAHDQVASLLRGLRVLFGTAQEGPVQPVPNEKHKSPQPVSTDLAFPTRPAAATPPAQQSLRTPFAQKQTQRVQQLLDELQREIKKLPQD
jgi:RNA polymerase sigma factor (sigma-70 family)